MTSFLSVFSTDITENEHKTRALSVRCLVVDSHLLAELGHPHTSTLRIGREQKNYHSPALYFTRQLQHCKTCDVTLYCRVWALRCSHLGAVPGHEGGAGTPVWMWGDAGTMGMSCHSTALAGWEAPPSFLAVEWGCKPVPGVIQLQQILLGRTEVS